MARTNWWGRLIGRRNRSSGGEVSVDRQTLHAATDYLDDFIASRAGVEVWVEAPTSFNRPSILLIARDGEWTRRVVPSEKWAHDFAAKRRLPHYDAGVVPYPQRMRDWNSRNKR